MSNDDRAIKPDPVCAHFLWGHDDFRESLAKTEVLTVTKCGRSLETIRANRKCSIRWNLSAKRSLKRFGTTPEGAPLKKRWADNDPFALAIQKAARMRKEGRVMKLFDAVGNLLAEKEVAE